MFFRLLNIFLTLFVLVGCIHQTIVTCDSDCELAKKESKALESYIAWMSSFEGTYRGNAGYYCQFIKLSDDKRYAVFKMYSKYGILTGIRAVKLDGYDPSKVGPWDWNAQIIKGEDYAFADLIDNGDGTYTCDTYRGCWSWSARNIDGGYAHSSYNITFEETDQTVKDLELLGYHRDNFKVEEMADALRSNYGLSSERAVKIAKITGAFEKIRNKRSLSESEFSIFTQEVLGTDFASAKKAYEQHLFGDSNNLDRLIGRAAELNGTTPEAVREIIFETILK